MYCNSCDRSFGSQQSLTQHLNSPAHTFDCDDCDRTFGSQQSLQQHLGSPAHDAVYECDECDRSFGSQQSLDQHLISPAHNFDCDDCDRTFASQQSLDQHLKSPHLYLPRGLLFLLAISNTSSGHFDELRFSYLWRIPVYLSDILVSSWAQVIYWPNLGI